MYSVAPVSNLGAPPVAPIRTRSKSKHQRSQSQPRPASRVVTRDGGEMVALGYHQTEAGVPPVPMIPDRSRTRRRSSLACATSLEEMMAMLTPPPPPPVETEPTPAITLKKKRSRSLRATSVWLPSRKSFFGIPPSPPLETKAPPRPPRPDDDDCLLHNPVEMFTFPVPPRFDDVDYQPQHAPKAGPPPRPPRPDEEDCLLPRAVEANPRRSRRDERDYMQSSEMYPPPVPPIPAGFLASVPKTNPAVKHGHSNSRSSVSSVDSFSINTPRQSQDSVDFRHVSVASSMTTASHVRTNSQKSTISYTKALEVPSLSVFEESSDDEEYTHSHRFRKSGLGLIKRRSHRILGSGNTTDDAATPAAPAPREPKKLHASEDVLNHHRLSTDDMRKRLTFGAHHYTPPTSVPALTDGSESSAQSSAGERTPPDDSFSKRFGRTFSIRHSGPKPEQPDEELMAMMDFLKIPAPEEDSERTSQPEGAKEGSKDGSKGGSKRSSKLFSLPSSNSSRESRYQSRTFGANSKEMGPMRFQYGI